MNSWLNDSCPLGSGAVRGCEAPSQTHSLELTGLEIVWTVGESRVARSPRGQDGEVAPARPG